MGDEIAMAITKGVYGLALLGPEVRFDLHSDVHKAAAGDAEDRDAEALPKKPHGSSPHSSATPKDEGPPDASIIFDLPALEPEDGEPDPVSDAPAPRHSSKPRRSSTAC